MKLLSTLAMAGAVAFALAFAPTAYAAPVHPYNCATGNAPAGWLRAGGYCEISLNLSGSMSGSIGGSGVAYAVGGSGGGTSSTDWIGKSAPPPVLGHQGPPWPAPPPPTYHPWPRPF